MATAKKRTKKTAAAKTAAKKTTSKTAKTPASKRKSAAKKPSKTKKTSAKKTAAAKKAAGKKTSPKKATVKKPKKKPSTKRGSRKKAAAAVDLSLFHQLTEGERANALRILTEDSRLSSMARVGRYRVIAVEPLAVKPPHEISGARLARVVVYDYATDRSVDGCVNLDSGKVAYLNITRAQPMLAREEEAAAISIALGDERVKEQLSLGDEPQVAMHYWSQNDTNLSFSRRSAAVIFGRPDARPSLIAVVDLLDNLVCDIVPASQW